MTKSEQLEYLIRYLAPAVQLPESDEQKRLLFRSLVNIRDPRPVSKQFLQIQDAFLQEEIEAKGVTDAAGLTPLRNNLCLWRGDITALKADAIVNAANSRMLGCFYPCHGCIDNAVHTYAGVQLRLECYEIMKRQGRPEPVGRAKITGAYNLPSKYILHTVGPAVSGEPAQADCALLASCYLSCLELAAKNSVKTLALCCVSTGEFRFPREAAARIAIKAVSDFFKKSSGMNVIFNVYNDEDFQIYRRLLIL